MKGITPVVATVLLMFIGIGAASTVYVYSNNVLESADKEVNLDIENLNAETCYRDNLRTSFVIRNPSDGIVNASATEIYINNQRTERERVSEGKVEAGETFKVTMPPEIEISAEDRVEVLYGDSKFDIRCREFTRPAASEAFKEGGDSISSFSFSGSIVPRTSSTSLCIGDSCPQSTGNEPTARFDTTNDYVNLRGDAVNGSLIADSANGTGSVCFGDNCPVNEGTSTKFLTEENNGVDGTLLLESFRTQNLCVGGNC